MKKFLIALLAMVALLLLLAYIQLFSRQADYHRTIGATTNSVLMLNNLDNTKVRIVVGGSGQIKVNLKGSAEDILSILQAESGIFTEISFPDLPSDISGTIVIPQGVLLDMTLSQEKAVRIEDSGGKKTIFGKNSFLVDTASLKSLSVDETGDVRLNGHGSIIVWDDQKWDSLDSSNDTGGIIYCGIGSQAIRNYCCETSKAGELVPECSGTGYWVFNNSARDCDYVCEQSASPEKVSADCGVGGQRERNDCCASQHLGEYQGCMGYWSYNSASQMCEFRCNSAGGSGDGGAIPGNASDSGAAPFSYGDAVSDYCVDVVSVTERDQCCNDALKNKLSTGPRPGFPDCIGTWKFDVQTGCRFECADHAEMMEILNELRQSAQ